MKEYLKKLNRSLSEKYINTFNYQPFVQTILLHKIYLSRKDVIPSNGTTVDGIDISQFESFIKYFKTRNYEFINERDIIEGLIDPNQRYIYLTFDDGYFNNFYALDILNKYQAKATFYISTNHIEEEKSFWWDVLFRERSKQKKDENFISQELKKLYQLKWQDQETYLRKEFGERALCPLNDLDRPMTKKELELFGKHDYVYLGNHTHNHLNTTIYSKEELILSIKIAEKFLSEITTKPVKSISYPYGFYNDIVVDTVKELDYLIGFTVNKGKNTIDEALDKSQQLRLKRVQLSGHSDINLQCHNLSINFSIANKVKQLFKGRV